MPIARTQVTKQGRITLPAELRDRLGVKPGEVLEWVNEGEKIVVRRATTYTFLDIHKAIFGNKPPKRRTIEEMDEGIREYIRTRHARGRY